MCFSSLKPQHFLSQMTVSVAAGSEECFFIDNVLAGQSIDLEYQVLVTIVTDGNIFKIICLAGDREQWTNW